MNMRMKIDYMIRKARLEDWDMLLKLYQDVASLEGGIARVQSEITEDYILQSLSKSISRGVIFVAELEGQKRLVGKIHASKLGPKVFSHVLSELTIGVHPDFQGRGIGKALFSRFLEEVITNRPDVMRVELMTRESNIRAIDLYKKIGFTTEGRLKKRIKSVTGGYEDDILMTWFNPNFVE